MNDAPMQALGQEFLVRRRLVLGTGLLLAGCTEPYRIPGAPLPVASLVARGPVEVVRDGRVEAGHDGMALYRGDTLHTGAASHALCRFDDGNQVWLDHDTRYAWAASSPSSGACSLP